VLDIVSRRGEATVYDVQGAFPEAERPRYTTLLTVLRTLERKGLVAHRTEGRTHVYRPAAEPGQVRGSVLSDVLDRVFGGSPKDLMAALLDLDDVTPEVLDELKALIREREAEDDGG